MKINIKNAKPYIITFIKWMVIAVFIGLVCGAAGGIFHFLIEKVTEMRKADYRWLILLPVFGLAIVFMYNKCKMGDDTGTNRVFSSIRTGEKIPFVMAPLIFIGTLLTHLGGGSAGREGAALQLGGSMGAFFGRVFKLNEKDMRTVTMCGMSAVFSAMFGTPLTAAIFCIEVISCGQFYFSALLPCVISAVTVMSFKMEPLTFKVLNMPQGFDMKTMLCVILLAAACAVVSIIFCQSMHISSDLYKKYINNPYFRILLGSALILGLTFLLRTTEYNGAGADIIDKAVSRGECEPYAFLLKILFTALTIGAGFKGGEIVPTMFIGATFGCFFGGLLGLNSGFAAALGLSAVFCGAVNCPITSIILSMELFGGGGMIYFAAACAVSYLLSGNYSLYTSQKIIYSKLEPTYISENKH